MALSVRLIVTVGGGVFNYVLLIWSRLHFIECSVGELYEVPGSGDALGRALSCDNKYKTDTLH